MRKVFALVLAAMFALPCFGQIKKKEAYEAVLYHSIGRIVLCGMTERLTGGEGGRDMDMVKIFANHSERNKEAICYLTDIASYKASAVLYDLFMACPMAYLIGASGGGMDLPEDVGAMWDFLRALNDGDVYRENLAYYVGKAQAEQSLANQKAAGYVVTMAYNWYVMGMMDGGN